jgi:hypothetical protein
LSLIAVQFIASIAVQTYLLGLVTKKLQVIACVAIIDRTWFAVSKTVEVYNLSISRWTSISALLSNVTILFRDVDQDVQVKAHHALVASITSAYGAVVDLLIAWVLIILALDHRIRLQVGVIVIHAHSI